MGAVYSFPPPLFPPVDSPGLTQGQPHRTPEGALSRPRRQGAWSHSLGGLGPQGDVLCIRPRNLFHRINLEPGHTPGAQARASAGESWGGQRAVGISQWLSGDGTCIAAPCTEQVACGHMVKVARIRSRTRI